MSDPESPQSTAAREALQKRALAEVEFIQMYTSEWLAEETEKLRERSSKRRRRTQAGTAPAFNVEEFMESDNVFVEGENASVGTITKRAAVKLHCQYEELNNADNFEQLCLGLNSILDLSCKYGSGQSSLFTSVLWKELQLQFSAPKHSATLSEKTINRLNKAIEQVVRDLGSTHHQLRHYELNAKDASSEFAFFAYSHGAYLLHKHKYIFDKDMEKSEADYMVKIWAPIFENLFEGTSVRTKWGDTKGRYSEASAVTIKIDLRMFSDRNIKGEKKEVDLADGEFASKKAGSDMFSTDHIKVLVEGKLLVDNLTEMCVVGSPKMIVLQVHGLELEAYTVMLRAPGLYFATTITKLVFPECAAELP